MGVLADSTGHVGWATALGGGALALILGSMFIVIGIKQRNGTLPRNRLVGYRTRTIMANDATWSAAHSASTGYTIATGAVLLITAVVLLTNPTPQVASAAIATSTVLGVGLVLVGALVSQRAAARVSQ